MTHTQEQIDTVAAAMWRQYSITLGQPEEIFDERTAESFKSLDERTLEIYRSMAVAALDVIPTPKISPLRAARALLVRGDLQRFDVCCYRDGYGGSEEMDCDLGRYIRHSDIVDMARNGSDDVTGMTLQEAAQVIKDASVEKYKDIMPLNTWKYLVPDRIKDLINEALSEGEE